jgi:hypothetical protein
VAAQISQGVWWSVFTIAGIVLGVLGYLRWQESRAAARGRSPVGRGSATVLD